MNKQSLRYVLYSIVYGTNIMYAIIVLVLGMVEETGVDMIVYGALFIFPALFSIIISYPIVRDTLEQADELDNLQQLQSDAITKLAVRHVPALLGLSAAMIYMYIY